MQKQIDQLNKQVHDTGKRQESLEMVETSLLTKLDKKESENYELKRILTEMRESYDVKADAISKA